MNPIYCTIEPAFSVKSRFAAWPIHIKISCPITIYRTGYFFCLMCFALYGVVEKGLPIRLLSEKRFILKKETAAYGFFGENRRDFSAVNDGKLRKKGLPSQARNGRR